MMTEEATSLLQEGDGDVNDDLTEFHVQVRKDSAGVHACVCSPSPVALAFTGCIESHPWTVFKCFHSYTHPCTCDLCMYVCVYAYMYVCTYVCRYTHT